MCPTTGSKQDLDHGFEAIGATRGRADFRGETGLPDSKGLTVGFSKLPAPSTRRRGSRHCSG